MVRVPLPLVSNGLPSALSLLALPLPALCDVEGHRKPILTLTPLTIDPPLIRQTQRKLRFKVRAMHNRYFVFFLFLAGVISQPVLAQLINITSVVGTSSGKREVEVGTQADIRGKFTVARTSTPPVSVQIAIRSVGVQGWQFYGHALFLKDQSGISFSWKTPDIDFGQDAEEGIRFHFIALAVTTDLPITEGPIDGEDLLFASLAVSDPILVVRWREKRDADLSEPRISIDSIGGQAVTPVGKYEVRLEEVIQGEVRRPEGTPIRVVVHPLSREKRWVMDRDPQPGKQLWIGSAIFGLQDLDEWSEYLAYTVLTKNELPSGEGISPMVWHRFMKTHIMTVSSPIHVQPIELPVRLRRGIIIISIDSRYREVCHA